MTSAEAPVPLAVRSKRPLVDPVPWPAIGASRKKSKDFRQNSSRNPIDVAEFASLYPRYSDQKVAVFACKLGDASQTKPARTAIEQNTIVTFRHFKCISANTASMIGIVTSAVRDTITKAMLAMKLSTTAASKVARINLFFLSRVAIG